MAGKQPLLTVCWGHDAGDEKESRMNASCSFGGAGVGAIRRVSTLDPETCVFSTQTRGIRYFPSLLCRHFLSTPSPASGNAPNIHLHLQPIHPSDPSSLPSLASFFATVCLPASYRLSPQSLPQLNPGSGPSSHLPQHKSRARQGRR